MDVGVRWWKCIGSMFIGKTWCICKPWLKSESGSMTFIVAFAVSWLGPVEGKICMAPQRHTIPYLNHLSSIHVWDGQTWLVRIIASSNCYARSMKMPGQDDPQRYQILEELGSGATATVCRQITCMRKAITFQRQQNHGTEMTAGVRNVHSSIYTHFTVRVETPLQGAPEPPMVHSMLWGRQFGTVGCQRQGRDMEGCKEVPQSCMAELHLRWLQCIWSLFY